MSGYSRMDPPVIMGCSTALNVITISQEARFAKDKVLDVLLQAAIRLMIVA